MKKTVIIYASTHHGNTRKLIEAISEKYQIDIIDAIEQKFANLSEYDLIGFASGIDFGKFYDAVEQFLKDNLPENKAVFFMYTCARDDKDFTYTMRTEAMKRHALLMGEYGCRGYNTYGAWKVIGGMNKHHPTKKELDGAVQFYELLIK
ncbi:MAG: flavodoxin [Peptococcaceae bacterium]|jgi:flavodoxin|nr:flavodoxin [Peptococcaceae bacterium]